MAARAGESGLSRRARLARLLSNRSDTLMLLSATPHQGKTDQFMRLMQLLDREAFPDESSVSRDRVRPFVIRTEKRVSINAEGQPLFKPRVTRLQAVVMLMIVLYTFQGGVKTIVWTPPVSGSMSLAVTFVPEPLSLAPSACSPQ